eukprot:SAG31_NODE_32064_length_360_cov_1.164751_1_plen_89_part_10
MQCDACADAQQKDLQAAGCTAVEVQSWCAGLQLTLAVHDAKLAIWHRNEGGGNFSELQREVFGITAYEGGNVFENSAGSSWARQWGIES